MTTASPPARAARRPGWRMRLLGWLGPRPVAQLLLVFALAAVAGLLGSTIADTMARIGVTPGFGFLERAANFEIGESAIAFRAGDSYARAIAVGVLNTVKVAVLGCVLATLLGTMLAIMRLSGHLMLSGLVRGYVEIVRNTPLLLQLFFWIALAHALPPPRRAISVLDSVFITNRGVYLPGVAVDHLTLATGLALSGVLVAWMAAVWRSRSGKPGGLRAPLPAGVLAVLALAAVVASSDLRIALEVPAAKGFNIQGGLCLTPEFAALLAALTVKFSAIIAEIIRAGILSVRKDQWDAARALGLSRSQIVRLVVLPQALRVIAPLTTSSYLDIVKDSSLAVAIGYPDLMNIANTTANTTGQALEALLIVVVLYLALNLSVSAVMNAYNNRVALRGGPAA